MAASPARPLVHPAPASCSAACPPTRAPNPTSRLPATLQQELHGTFTPEEQRQYLQHAKLSYVVWLRRFAIEAVDRIVGAVADAPGELITSSAHCR